jgi:D-amino-acid dehydrogenase
MNQPDVLIIGGGVMGVASAYYLAKDGVSVTVIDKGRIGHACSYGNAGWLTPSHAVPLPSPGAVRKGLKWMFDKDSPLYIKPRLSGALYAWLWRFARSATQRHLEYGANILMPFGRESLNLYQQFVAEHPQTDIGFHQRGLLMVCRTEDGMHHARREAELAARQDLPHQVMSVDELRAFEPAVNGPIVGGVYLPAEADAEPLATVLAMAEAAKAHGAVFLPHTEVYDLERAGSRITGLRTTAGMMTADRYVLATGSWSPRFAESLGLNIPVQGGKGYAMILDPIDPMPRGPMSLVETKVAVTPRADSLRLAGTMEIAGLDESITVRRLRAILRGAANYINVPDEPKISEVWRGLRPCTPDGLPMIGRIGRWDNGWIATGHAMLGFTLGAATGRLMADLLQERRPLVDPRPFDPERFS